MGCEPVLNLAATPNEAVSIICTIVENSIFLTLWGKLMYMSNTTDRPVFSLVGNVGDMSATCRADTSMLADFPDIPFFCRHPFLPIWPFPHVLMLGNANISIVTESTTLQLSTHNYKNGTTHIITCHNIASRGHLSSHKYQIS